MSNGKRREKIMRVLCDENGIEYDDLTFWAASSWILRLEERIAALEAENAGLKETDREYWNEGYQQGQLDAAQDYEEQITDPRSRIAENERLRVAFEVMERRTHNETEYVCDALRAAMEGKDG